MHGGWGGPRRPRLGKRSPFGPTKRERKNHHLQEVPAIGWDMLVSFLEAIYQHFFTEFTFHPALPCHL